MKNQGLSIPAGPAELTAAWLTAALRQGGAIQTAAVQAFEVLPLDENKGFFGQLVRVRLAYDRPDAGAPASLVAKFSSATPEMRKRSISSYEREVRFYQLLADQSRLPTPTCYYADIDLESGLHVLLLQDLAPAASGSRIAGCSPDRARFVVEQIAHFHATWWENPQLAELHWLAEDGTDVDAEAMRVQYAQWWPHFLEKLESAEHALPEPIRHMGERIGSQRADIRRYVFGTAPRTLIHRDYHLENMVFGGPEGGVPFAVIDWQFFSRGRAVWDVAYFLSENMQIEDRRTAERDRWAGYHRLLVEDGVRDYSFDQCMQDVRYCLLQRFTALVSTIAAMPFSQEQLRIHIEVLLPRNCAALLDHNAVELVP